MSKNRDKSIIPYGRQNISENDLAAVLETLKSSFLTQGPKVKEFENKVADYCEASHAVAAANATACLHISCLALGVNKGDVVWTSPNTFVASSNCALYCGANIDFVDIDPDTFNMCHIKLEEKLRTATKTPKVIIPVHFSGQSCNMAAIHELSKKYGFKIIEDASHCIGGSYKNKKIGSCQYSDITVFSFHPVKIITTGEGGMCTTNNPELAEKLATLRTHGITRDNKAMEKQPHGLWYYEQTTLGYNYRITDIQCSLGISQLDRLDSFIDARRKKVAHYTQVFNKLDSPIKLPSELEDSFSSWHLYVIQIDPARTSKTRLDLYNFLHAAGIGVNVHYIPVHLQPFYQKLGFKHGDFPNAEAYYEHALTIPLFPDLSDENQEYVIEKIKEFFDE